MIVHGGAGSGKFGRDDRRFGELRAALEEGLSAMRRGSSLDGVEAAVYHMEGSGAFNCGRGACLAVDGTVQLDAAVMRGDRRSGAGVGAVTCTYHPVKLARWVMEETGHVLMVGDRCRDVARTAGLSVERLKPSRAAAARYAKMLREAPPKAARQVELWRRIRGGGTVGAVAVDASGTSSAAVSTGGVWLKLPGRVGDSAILGAGVYAGGAGAACATGDGEEIIRNALSWNAYLVLARDGAVKAADRSIRLMTENSGSGTAGIITVDAKGRTGAACNTEAMGRAWYDRVRGRIVVAV